MCTKLKKGITDQRENIQMKTCSDFEDEIDEVVRPDLMQTTTIAANNVTLPSQPGIYTSKICRYI